jgi:hypothetical protein
MKSGHFRTSSNPYNMLKASCGSGRHTMPLVVCTFSERNSNATNEQMHLSVADVRTMLHRSATGFATADHLHRVQGSYRCIGSADPDTHRLKKYDRPRVYCIQIGWRPQWRDVLLDKCHRSGWQFGCLHRVWCGDREKPSPDCATKHEDGDRRARRSGRRQRDRQPHV